MVIPVTALCSGWAGEHLRSFQWLFTKYSDHSLHPSGVTIINVDVTCSLHAAFSLPVFVNVVLFFSLAFIGTEKCYQCLF